MNKAIIILVGIIFSLPAKSQNWEALQGGIPYVTGTRVLYADSVDNYLYTGGNFYFESNGNQFNMIARWDGMQWDAMGTGIIGAGNVLTMERYNGELFVAGGFDSVGGIYAKNIATWNGNNWDSLPIQPFTPSSNGSPWILKLINNELYMGGTFDTVVEMPVTGIAKWNGSNWSSVNFPNLQSFSSINAIVEYNGEIYAAGNFSNGIPNDTLGEIARYDGASWRSVGGGILGSMAGVESMVVYNGELYVAGYFFTSSGNAGNHIQKWNGTTWSDVGGGTNLNNGQVHKLVVHNGKLYAMGVLEMAGNVPADRIAVWDGTEWCGLGSSFENVILAGCVYQDTLHVGGGFWTIDGDSMNHIAKWTGGDYTDTCGVIGVNETEVNNFITVFPNPNNGIFTVEKSNLDKTTIEIYNLSGQLILKTLFVENSIQIDLTDYLKGLYFVKISSDNKVIIEKISYQ